MDIRRLVPIPVATTPLPAYYGASMMPGAAKFNALGAINSSMDYYKVGATGGMALGCAAGGITTAPAGGWGCLASAPTGYLAGGILFGVWGFIEGALSQPGADAFSTGPEFYPDAGVLRP